MDKKIAAIQNEISTNPKSAKLYNKLGVTYARYGKYKEALKNLEKAVSLDGGYFSAYNNIGKVYYLSAVKKKSSFKNKYAYLEMGSKQTEIRASDRAKIDTMVEWDYD